MADFCVCLAVRMAVTAAVLAVTTYAGDCCDRSLFA